MVAEGQLKRTGVARDLDRLNANRRIVNPDRRGRDAETDCHAALSAQPFTPYDQLERAVAVLQEQLMNGVGLVHDREVELPGCGEGAVVGQNGRQVVKVDRSLARRIVGLEEAKGLVAALVGTVP